MLSITDFIKIMNLAFGFLGVDFKFDELQAIFALLDEGNGYINYSKYFSYIRDFMGPGRGAIVSIPTTRETPSNTGR